MKKKSIYIAFYKPFGVLSQFTPDHPGQSTLSDYIKGIPIDVYPIGRLDKDSEGLLLLTNDKELVDNLLNPGNKKSKTYLVQLEGEMDEKAIYDLNQGVSIRVGKKNIHTLPARVYKISSPDVPERNPPIRFRKSIPTSWISIMLHEGKNRQIRKMCAAVGCPVLRLIRVGINKSSIDQLNVGEWKYINKKDII